MSDFPIVLLTDFGTRDAFVGILKGVILNKAPKARIGDLCHEIPPQDIRSAAFQLMTSCPFFPGRSLFVCVVDPGVGSKRKILYVRTDRHQFLAPDNGLLSWVLEREQPREIREVRNEKLFLRPVSCTFQGRDIFAAVAGALLAGTPASQLGPSLKEWKKIPFPQVRKTPQGVRGEILTMDRFGNLVTNLAPQDLPPPPIAFQVASTRLYGLSSSYSEAAKGRPLAILGSSGFIEISTREASAAEKLRLKPGDAVEAKRL